MKTRSSHQWAVLLTVGLFFSLQFSSLQPFAQPVYSQDPASVQVIESDHPSVIQGGAWSSQDAPASNGSYLFSSGAEDDVLALAFVGSAIEIIYVAGPKLGTLAIEVDGTVVRTVITTTEKVTYAQSTRIDYLTEEPHSLKVYAQEGGIVAIDAFVITPHSAFTRAVADEEGSTQASSCAPLNSTHRVSVTSTGAQAAGVSYIPSLSSDARFVAFRSGAPLVPRDTNIYTDIYVYDRTYCVISLISTDSVGTIGNNHSYTPYISADGRYIAFESDASNLVAGDTNSVRDIFVHDRQTSTTTRVSVATDGTPGNNNSFRASLSSNGRYVTFDSTASSLVSDDTNGQSDIFVHDRQTSTTTRVSVATGGIESIGGEAGSPTITSDGRYVAFESSATNLVANDLNSAYDIFVHDRQTTTTTRVSLSTGAVEANGSSSYPVFTPDGRYVTYESEASNLVVNDSNGFRDVFVHDRQTSMTTRVSVATSGAQATGGHSLFPVISADGRYVAYQSDATDLVAADTNGQNDIFVHDRQTSTTTRISITFGSAQATGGGSFNPTISSNGSYIAFESSATNLVNGDTNGTQDIFVTFRTQPSLDSLALFNPAFNHVDLLSTLTDNPPVSAYTAFSAYAPVSGGTWVMGDWNADGLDTPGVYRNGVFYFTNKANESQPSDWGGFWIGINGPPVAGRFSNVSANDCIGAVDAVPAGSVTIFALYFTCDLAGTNPTPPLTFQWLSSPLPNPIFSGTHQFMAGDFNGDGLDSIAIRRNEFIAYGNVTPSAGPAVLDLAQYIGVPGTGDNGAFVVGDWDGNGVDSFGLFYQNGELYYRNDLDFNSGIHFNQTVGVPFGNVGVQVATWR